VYIHGEGNQLRLAATDSFRLAEEIITLPGEIDDFSVLLPLTTAQEVIRLFSEAETLTLLPQESHIAFVGDGLHLSSRLVAGQFPDYRQIIPQQYTMAGEVDSAELRRALKTAAVFLPKDTRRVQMVLTPNEETLVLKVVGNETGEGEVTIPFEGKGDPIEVLFNVHYVLEGATRLGTPKCQLQLVGGGDPVLFRPVGGERQYLYVVMPIQL
jgi:DNA polymerase-3 subunit beta